MSRAVLLTSSRAMTAPLPERAMIEIVVVILILLALLLALCALVAPSIVLERITEGWSAPARALLMLGIGMALWYGAKFAGIHTSWSLVALGFLLLGASPSLPAQVFLASSAWTAAVINLIVSVFAEGTLAGPIFWGVWAVVMLPSVLKWTVFVGAAERGYRGARVLSSMIDEEYERRLRGHHDD